MGKHHTPGGARSGRRAGCERSVVRWPVLAAVLVTFSAGAVACGGDAPQGADDPSTSTTSVAPTSDVPDRSSTTTAPGQTTTSATSATPTTTATTTPTPTTAAAPTTTAPTGADEPALPGLVFQDSPRRFRTPSGNIRCVMAQGAARCDVLRYTYEPPPPPADCPLDWGYSVTIAPDEQRGGFGCSSDTEGGDEILPYGHVVVSDGVACLSSRIGVRCTTDEGHGFFVSRQTYEFY